MLIIIIVIAVSSGIYSAHVNNWTQVLHVSSVNQSVGQTSKRKFQATASRVDLAMQNSTKCGEKSNNYMPEYMLKVRIEAEFGSRR